MQDYLKYFTLLFLNQKIRGDQSCVIFKMGIPYYLNYSKILNKVKKFAPLIQDSEYACDGREIKGNNKLCWSGLSMVHFYWILEI